MAQFYVIKDVKKGNEWQNSFGTFQSYSLSLEGMGEPVNINKAVPVKEEPTTGQQIYGTVEMLQSQKGTTYYKFKTEKVPDDQYTGSSATNAPTGSYVAHNDDKEDSIARAVALKAAVELHSGTDVKDGKAILATAEGFLPWLKNDSGTSSAGGSTSNNAAPSNEGLTAPAAAPSKRDWAKVGQAEPHPEPPEDLLSWIQEEDS